MRYDAVDFILTKPRVQGSMQAFGGFVEAGYWSLCYTRDRRACSSLRLASVYSRIALAAIITTLQKLKDVDLPCEVMVAATVQEEFVMKGAQAVFASTQPDVVVNLEVGIAKDFPLHFPTYLSHYPSLSKGPTIFVYDNSMLPTNGLVEYFTELAHTYEIPFQYEAELINYGQDGCRLQGAGCGTYVINLGIPTRYVHAHYGILDRSDFENMVLLLERFLTTFDQEALENLAL